MVRGLGVSWSHGTSCLLYGWGTGGLLVTWYLLPIIWLGDWGSPGHMVPPAYYMARELGSLWSHGTSCLLYGWGTEDSLVTWHLLPIIWLGDWGFPGHMVPPAYYMAGGLGIPWSHGTSCLSYGWGIEDSLVTWHLLPIIWLGDWGFPGHMVPPAYYVAGRLGIPWSHGTSCLLYGWGTGDSLVTWHLLPIIWLDSLYPLYLPI